MAEQQGPSSETLGLIGRIHKDEWKEAVKADDMLAAIGHLDQAINAYRRGYMADQRDAYPGINLLTLLESQGEKESLEEKDRLLPVGAFRCRATTGRLNARLLGSRNHARAGRAEK